MIEPITIRGNIRMSNYGQLIYNKNQEHFYTWHEELDFILKEYPITNPVYDYSPHDIRFNIATKTSVSKLRIIRQHFAHLGIDLQFPYLNPYSCDVYNF